MRIGFFTWESKNSVMVGGISEVVTYLTEALAKMGHEVHVFTRIGHQQKEHVKINGVYEHRVIFKDSPNILRKMDNMCDSMIKCFDYVEDKYGKFDIIHGHDWHVLKAMKRLKQKKKYKPVVTFHSTEWGRSGNHHQKSALSRKVLAREREIAKLAKVLTTVSHTLKREVAREYKIPCSKINVIYNGINSSEYKGKVNPSRVKKTIGLKPKDPMILFMGRLCHQKGPDTLIEAVPKVVEENPCAQFVFAGDGNVMAKRIKKRARKLKVKDNVHLLGYVEGKEKLDLFKSCDLLCVPSRNEPFGIITLEAWSAGKPVVSSNVGGPSEIITNFHDGIKVPRHPDAFAWGINYLLNHPSGREIERMGRNAKKSVRKYTWRNLAKEYVEVYEELLS